MRIHITGASGQLGSALAQRLKACADVIATDRAALDLAKPDSIPAILDEIAPDLVINAAAYTAVDRAEKNPDLAQLVNADAPGAIGRWCAARDVPLIHFSTDYIFGGRGAQPWSEDDAPHPLSVYGATKLAGEEQIRAACGCSLIIRSSWIYAAEGTNFLRKIAELAKTHKELRIVADQFGAPTSAALIAKAVCLMLENGLPRFREKAGEASGLLHIAASGEASWHEFATQIVDGLRSRGLPLTVERILPIRTEEYPLPARRPLNSRFSLHRLHTVFGIVPPQWPEALDPELNHLARLLSA